MAEKNEKKLYCPEKLYPVHLLRENERWITGRELELRNWNSEPRKIVTGEEQFEFLWSKQSSFPEQWKQIQVFLIPDFDSRTVISFSWSHLFQNWDVSYHGFEYPILVCDFYKLKGIFGLAPIVQPNELVQRQQEP